MIFLAWVSDKYRQRAATIAVQVLMSIVGLLMTGFLHSPGRRYAGKKYIKRLFSPCIYSTAGRDFPGNCWLNKLHPWYPRIRECLIAVNGVSVNQE